MSPLYFLPQLNNSTQTQLPSFTSHHRRRKASSTLELSWAKPISLSSRLLNINRSRTSSCAHLLYNNYNPPSIVTCNKMLLNKYREFMKCRGAIYSDTYVPPHHKHSPLCSSTGPDVNIFYRSSYCSYYILCLCFIGTFPACTLREFLLATGSYI